MTSRVYPVSYGHAALEALRSIVTEAKRYDRMAPTTILLPNNIAGIVARRHLAHGLERRGPGVAGIHLTTLPRLAEQLAAATLHPRRPATGPILASAWRRVLDDDPGCFAQVKDHPATIRALVAAHRELRNLTAAARDQARSATTLSPDLLRLHEAVVTALSSAWYDTTDLLHAAAQVVADHPERTHELGVHVLYLPQALTLAESRLAQALAAEDGLTVIAGMTGVQRADAAVRTTLDRLGLQPPAQPPKPALATRVMHASDSDDEVRCVVRDVVDALVTTPAHRMAVLYGSATPYARLLHEHFAAAGITVNGPSTRAVHERAIARGLLGVLELAAAELPRAQTFLALSQAPTQDFRGERVPVARWERISRHAGIVGGDDWQPRLEAYVDRQRHVIAEQEAADDPSLSRIEAAQREIHTAQSLSQFGATLRDRLNAGQAEHTWSGLSRWAIDLFHDLYGAGESFKHLPAEEQYAAAVVETSLAGLATLDAFEPRADLQSLTEVLALGFESALPRVGRFGEGVFVGPLSAAIGMHLDRVYVVGLAEDGYPGRLHEDALLADELREVTGGELTSARERLDAKQRHLLAAFACAAHVTASFPRGDLRRSTARLPSRWLLHTLRSLTGDPQLTATDWEKGAEHLISSASYATSVTSTARPAHEQEWRVRAASAEHKLDDDVVDAAHAVLQARASESFTRYDGNLSGAQELPDYAHEERVISPTSLEKYARCPHQYFVAKLLRVEPIEHPEEIITISPMEIGNLIHASMDQLIAEADRDGALPSYGEPWRDAHRRRLAEIAAAQAKVFADRGVTGHPLLWQREEAQVLVDLDRMLDDDNAWRAERQARVVRSELEFGRNDVNPVVIAVADGEVRMLGSVDKVDVTSDGVMLVTDIKSGSKRTFTTLETDPVAAGTKLQLPVYAYAARQLLGGDQVEAAYWFVRRDDAGKRIKLKLDEAVEQLYADTLGTLVASIASGLFLPKPADKPSYGWVSCAYCDPDGRGHGDLRQQYERKRLDPALHDLIALIDAAALPTDSTAEGVPS